MQDQPTKSKKKEEKGLPISAKWQSEAEKLIDTAGIRSLDSFNFEGKYFRRHFYPAVANVYFDELLEFVITEHGLDKTKIVKSLALDYATKKRWLENSHPPAADKIFAILLLILKKEFKDVPFSSPPELIFMSVCRQLRMLGEDFCENKPSCVMTRTAFRSLAFAMKKEEIDKLIPGQVTSIKMAEDLVDEIRSHVNTQWKVFTNSDAIRFGYSGVAPVVTRREMHDWIVHWGMPYTLFAMGSKKMQWGVTDV